MKFQSPAHYQFASCSFLYMDSSKVFILIKMKISSPQQTTALRFHKRNILVLGASLSQLNKKPLHVVLPVKNVFL